MGRLMQNLSKPFTLWVASYMTFPKTTVIGTIIPIVGAAVLGLGSVADHAIQDYNQHQASVRATQQVYDGWATETQVYNNQIGTQQAEIRTTDQYIIDSTATKVQADIIATQSALVASVADEWNDYIDAKLMADNARGTQFYTDEEYSAITQQADIARQQGNAAALMAAEAAMIDLATSSDYQAVEIYHGYSIIVHAYSSASANASWSTWINAMGMAGIFDDGGTSGGDNYSDDSLIVFVDGSELEYVKSMMLDDRLNPAEGSEGAYDSVIIKRADGEVIVGLATNPHDRTVNGGYHSLGSEYIDMSADQLVPMIMKGQRPRR